MALEPTFRAANLADASALTVLVDIAGDGVPNWLWHNLAGPGRSALGVGRERARREEGGFSYRHAILAVIENEVVACLIGYPLDEPYDLNGLEDMPAHVQPLVRLEAQVPGSCYVNVLATFPEFRGQDIGARLLEIAETKGQEVGARAMSIIVGSWNEGAVRLYRRAGYDTVAAEQAILPPDFPKSGEWILMMRPLMQ